MEGATKQSMHTTTTTNRGCRTWEHTKHNRVKESNKMTNTKFFNSNVYGDEDVKFLKNICKSYCEDEDIDVKLMDNETFANWLYELIYESIGEFGSDSIADMVGKNDERGRQYNSLEIDEDDIIRTLTVEQIAKLGWIANA
jgi:hypothetical protein